MARKGVLISDPSVARMTDLMWLFEYRAMQLRERDTMRALKDLLGNNAFNSDAGDRDSYVPLATLIGNPEVLAKVVEALQDTQAASSSAKDDDFDAFSEYLMRASDPTAPAAPLPTGLTPEIAAALTEPLVVTDEQRAAARRNRPENIAAERRFVKFDD